MSDNFPIQNFKDKILREEGIRYRAKGYKSPKSKLKKESFIKAI